MEFVNVKVEPEIQIMPYFLSEDHRIQREASYIPIKRVAMKSATKEPKSTNITTKPSKKRETMFKLKIKKKKQKCNLCGKRFSLQSHVANHLSGFRNYKAPFECIDCNAIFQHPCQLSLHTQKMKHSAEKFPCTECEKIFPRQSKLDHHMKLHTRTKKKNVNVITTKQLASRTVRGSE